MIIMLSLLELFLRLTEISLPSFVYDDAKLGRTFKPNSQIFSDEAEGFCVAEVNKFGYLGPPYSQKRESNSVRIALIGDSFVEGLQLFDRNHFRSILENELKAKLNKNIEVLNFGIGGIDFRGMFLIYSQKVIQYNPDIVLFFPKAEDFLRRDELPTPQIELKNNNLYINYNSYLNNPETKLRREFHIIRNYSIGNLFKEVFESIYRGELIEQVFGDLFDFHKNNNFKVENKNSIFIPDEYFNINERIIKELSNDFKKRHIKNIFVLINSLPDSYYKLFRTYNIQTINLEKELSKYDRKDTNYWKASGKFGHWNYYGHKIVAKFLANNIINYI